MKPNQCVVSGKLSRNSIQNKVAKKYQRGSYLFTVFLSLFLLTNVASAQWMKAFCNASVKNQSGEGSINARAEWIFKHEVDRKRRDVLIARLLVNNDTMDTDVQSKDIQGTTATYDLVPPIGAGHYIYTIPLKW